MGSKFMEDIISFLDHKLIKSVFYTYRYKFVYICHNCGCTAYWEFPNWKKAVIVKDGLAIHYSLSQEKIILSCKEIIIKNLIE